MRLADHLCDLFGPEEQGKRRKLDAHPEVEMALVELYRATGERRYLEQEGIDFDERLLGLKVKGTLYLDGLWQSEGYFKDVEQTIREDLRIIPPMDALNQRMADEIRNFIREKNADVNVKYISALEPYMGEFSGRYAAAAAEATEFAFGRAPAFTREGGSIGAVVTMKKYLKSPPPPQA